MVKEIRDLEIAEMVIQASLTNHLVLIYITYQQCCGVITHLRDMGIERFLLSSTLIGMAAQRLVRVGYCAHNTNDRN